MKRDGSTFNQIRVIAHFAELHEHVLQAARLVSFTKELRSFRNGARKKIEGEGAGDEMRKAHYQVKNGIQTIGAHTMHENEEWDGRSTKTTTPTKIHI